MRPRRKRRNFCCARSLRSRRCASKCVRSFPGLRRQDLQRIFQQAERRPAGPAFCFTLPETACHGAPLSWIGRRLPNAKCTAAFSIARLKRGSASAQRAPCLGLENSSMKGQQLHCIGVRHITAGNASRLFRASVANLPASRAQRQARPHLVECKAFNRHGDPFKILPTKRRSEQGRGWRVFAYGATPFAHPLHCRLFSIRFNLSPHPVFRKAKEAAGAASLEPSKRVCNVGFFIRGSKGGPPATL